VQEWLAWVIRNEIGDIVGFLTATTRQDGDAHIAYGIGSRFWGHGYAKSGTEQLLLQLSQSAVAFVRWSSVDGPVPVARPSRELRRQ
jgi:hypothetical protein